MPENAAPSLHIALPVMDEQESLPRILECIAAQSYPDFKVYICVNQPDTYWSNTDLRGIAERNISTLRLLHQQNNSKIVLIDHASPGHGWKGKKHGVGQARKVIMDEISRRAAPDDVVISLDADTSFPENYFQTVAENFRRNPDAVAASLPYYHPLPKDPSAARAILRYEIYMRHYFLNLARIGSPYAFTAMGSAMAFTVKAYRAIGGMTPKLSGEDFYFLQKLRKYGTVLLWNETMVFPEARFSDRVFFGTGPAMIKGAAGDWSSYPIYPDSLFKALLETYLTAPLLFLETFDTEVIRFLKRALKEEDPFRLLRENHSDSLHFIRAFHEKLDGLRILQFLKTHNNQSEQGDEANLFDFLDKYCPGSIKGLQLNREHFSFCSSPLTELEKIRNFLFEKEMEVRVNSERL